jgi:hypothetical protein
MPFINFRKKFRLFSFDFRQNFDVRTFPQWLSSTAPPPAEYGPSPRQNNISAAGVRYLGVVFNVYK